jgi:type IV pilus assembly protein PilM
MALAFFKRGPRKRPDHILAVDLGDRITKAVHVQRRGDSFVLSRFLILDSPIFEKTIPLDLLTEHLKKINQVFDGKSKPVALTVGVNDVVVRHVELPVMPPDEIRSALKFNARVYLQQDMTNHVFDCFVDQRNRPAEPPKNQAGHAKQRVLVAGAKRELITDFAAGAKSAGLVADHVVPGVLAPVNAFEKAMPEVFSKESVALVDIGFKSSSISILKEGELMLSRVVNIGGDRLTTGLSEFMNISYAEAEGIKVGMAGEVQNVLESQLTPLGRELRASIDFFEHQQDRSVSQVFLSGGSSKSEFIVETLRRELMVECRTWNPTTFMKLALSAEQSAELEPVAPQLIVAIGAAVTAL